ncbi:sensor domain-containing diguanylate cyclase [Gluconacetobacter azotocaptans]|uniref:diguanylate cyclase domain-containing protein n=1 Tax=Gluconacetobacter azotocaptans TaxID=142834 RepID=UPI0019587ED2|nr:diguanylate cyclase [Gluconacetobacter azotocaptans]MBM9401238.1 sensor domain-containing diguanylate cyclase [Gluconacetobacter azotocaptans]
MGWRPCRPAESKRGIKSAVLLVAAFGVSALTTRFLCSDEFGYSSFWPANAAMLVALLTLRARLSVFVVVACLLLNFFINKLSALSPPESLLACILNVILVLLAAPFTRRFCGALTDLTRPRRFVAFTIIAMLSAATEAGIGVLIETVFLNDPGTPFAEWLQWVLCDALGLMLATPAALHLVRSSLRARPYPDPDGKAVTLLMLCILLTILSFSWSRSPLFLFVYPVLAMLGFHARPIWILISIFFVSIFASALTAHGFGPIAQLSPDGHLMREDMLQPYLFSLFLVVLPINNAIGERRRYTRRLLLMKVNLEHVATHDMLTSAMNRQMFETALRSMIRNATPGAVLFIDIDDFKGINDSLGHQAGDDFLRVFSARLIELIKGFQGCVARYGGDEFAAIIPGTFSYEKLDLLCASLSDSLREPYLFFGIERSVTASIGAATIESNSINADDIMRRVDIALYMTKASGRNGYSLFNDHVVEAPPPRVSTWR